MLSTKYCLERLHDLHSSLPRSVTSLLLAFISCGLSANDYVLLNNGNVIVGKATFIGSHVIVDRGDGNELKLPARQVAHSAGSIIELYRFRQSQRQYPHVEGFQDDARWCFRHELLGEMKEALDAAQTLDPTHPETTRLRRQLVSATNLDNGPLSVEVESKNVQTAPLAGRAIISVASTNVKRHQPEEVPDSELAKANLSFQAVSYFSNRIQPLLINRCGNAGCHRSGSETPWQLTHMGSHVRLSSRMTKLNLIATLALIDREDGQASDLLRYATTAHGGKQDPPLKRGDEAAIESMKDWIDEVCQNESLDVDASLTEFPTLPAATAPVVANQRQPSPIESFSGAIRQVSYADDSTVAADVYPVKPPIVMPKSSATPTRSENRPSRLPVVENPFDPAIFNRNYRERGGDSDRDK